jgi:two-component system chemotaxis sensor kinase CheA
MNTDDDILAAAREGFLEEARDTLVQFEQALLAVEDDPADAEALNSAFRAAHTLKGGAGLFGYDAVVLFTHEVESVLDLMREGRLPLTPEGMALLLQSRDQMDRLVAEVGSSQPDPDTAELSQALGRQLRALMGDKAAAAPVAMAAVAEAAGGVRHWHLSIEMGADALRNGLDPLSFIRYLDTLGDVAAVHTPTHRVPPLAALDAEGCSLGFEIRLATAAGRAAIEDVFSFLVDDCDLAVLEPDAGPEAWAALLERRAPDAAARAALLKAWQDMGVPFDPNAVDTVDDADAAVAPMPGSPAAPDRRKGKPERRAGGDDTRFIRVRADKLDQLIDLIGELVIASSGAQMVAQAESSPRFSEAALRIHDLVQAARDGALGLRMVPIGETFSRFQRIVRDVSKQLGKDVDLHITGGDTELDKSMVEVIADPLMHLVRNSLDHGLETPDKRHDAGKASTGQLALHAYHESGSVVIEVSDDGRGLDRERILAKAIERGLLDAEAAAALPDAEVWLLIFAPGFSTAAAVTDLSGRGVGMDVVKRNIEALRGQIQLTSTPGRGMTTQIRLPLTLAMIDGFLTLVGGVHYVLPLAVVHECIDLPAECRADGSRTCGTFDLRGEVLPWLDLAHFYGVQPQPGANGRRSLIVVRDGAARLGLVVDRLLGEHQTVIKPLAGIFRPLKALAGSTILGSGDVALVLDLQGLLAAAMKPAARPAARPLAGQ